MDHIPFLNSQKEYPTDMAIQISKTPIIIVNIMVSSSQIPAIPSKATKMPPIIKSFPPNRVSGTNFPHYIMSKAI